MVINVIYTYKICEFNSLYLTVRSVLSSKLIYDTSFFSMIFISLCIYYFHFRTFSYIIRLQLVLFRLWRYDYRYLSKKFPLNICLRENTLFILFEVFSLIMVPIFPVIIKYLFYFF